ncbi:hypothetical protein Leryth_015317 [Lithospermum erythrorhizon]|nr:hypothetical protein Leryth_015317 [Lithospermum erythrorhizon]
MFDWNDREITNVIWGEGRESDDHIVPYSDGNEENNSGAFGYQTRKEGWNEEASSLKPDEQKKSITGADFLGPKKNGSPKYEGDKSLEEGLGLESSPATAISNSIKTEKDSTRIGSSNDLTGIAEHNASRQGETSCLNVSSEIFQNQQQDEQGNFANYGWDNIGSFDDLDRIFSNDDPIFGHESLSNVDELWSPSNDITSSPEKSIPLSFEAPSLEVGALPTLSGQLETSSGCSLDQDPLSPISMKTTNTTSKTPNFFWTCNNAIEYSEGENKPLKTDNTTKEASGKTHALNSRHSCGPPNMQKEFVDEGVQKKQMPRTGVRSKEKYEVRQLQDICGTWSTSANQLQQFDSQYAPEMGQPYLPFVITQHRQLIGPQSSQYNHFPGPFFNSPLHVNMGTQYPPIVGFPQHYSGEGSHQNVISGSGASPVTADDLKKFSDPPTQPLLMTPQEKIEKLRRKQQMRAMLAIQKQQEKFNNQASSAETSTLDGANSEIDETMTMLPSSKPFEKDGSAIGVRPDDHSIEDSILFHLQHIIGKLDIRIRVCIRDSLFRLAQSAVQRQYASDISSTIRSCRDEGFNKGEQNSQNRFSNMPHVETATNSIDRAVAHLLFHRPLESSDNHAARPDSSSSPNLSCERKIDLTSLPITQLPQNLGNEVDVSHDGAKASLLFTEADQLRKSPGLDVQKISSADEATTGAVFRSGSSQ